MYEPTYKNCNAIQSRAEENLMWEEKLEAMMKTMKNSKRRLEGNYNDTL